MIQLSSRLKAVANFVTRTDTVCDVGCDHGYVSIYLIENRICKKVIAADVRKGPLDRAREHIIEYGLQKYIEPKLSDGLKGIKIGEAQSMVCAGMGGRLMKKILSDGTCQISQMEELVLQPQSEVSFLRKYLNEQGYFIVDENMIFEDGKYYPILKVHIHQQKEIHKPDYFSYEEWIKYSERYGPWLLLKKDGILKLFLEHEISKQNSIIQKLESQSVNERSNFRLMEVKQELKDLEFVLRYVKSS